MSLLSGQYPRTEYAGHRRGRCLTLSQPIKEFSKDVVFYVPICSEYSGGIRLSHSPSMRNLSWCPWCPRKDPKPLPFLAFPSFLLRLLSAPYVWSSSDRSRNMKGTEGGQGGHVASVYGGEVGLRRFWGIEARWKRQRGPEPRMAPQGDFSPAGARRALTALNRGPPPEHTVLGPT